VSSCQLLLTFITSSCDNDDDQASFIQRNSKMLD